MNGANRIKLVVYGPRGEEIEVIVNRVSRTRLRATASVGGKNIQGQIALDAQGPFENPESKFRGITDC